MTIAALRTSDDRFVGLPGYSYQPHYRDDLPGFAGLRLHHLDLAGPAGPTFLCLHGQPAWSYLYRKMIPILAAAGRVVVPDLFGFGRSDKPVDEAVYTFDFHRRSILALVEALDLRDITLVLQDWGGILGLTLPVTIPDRIKGLIVMNTGFATGDRLLGEGFPAWKAYNRSRPDLDIAALMTRAVVGITKAEAQAYAAPYPDARFKSGVRRFPELFPMSPDAAGADVSRAAARWWRDEFDGPAFMAVGMRDPVITPRDMDHLHAQIRGCAPPMRLDHGGHFLQEHGEEVARAALRQFGLMS